LICRWLAYAVEAILAPGVSAGSGRKHKSVLAMPTGHAYRQRLRFKENRLEMKRYVINLLHGYESFIEMETL
jgi:hypothetical protein